MGNQIHCSPVPGRVKSKLPTNMFKVKNINEQGEVIWRGLIEVSRAELVLHQKIGDPVRWPLKSLRRYGFDKGLFSFESGRSCATGPGIYAFKCKNAEQLFNLVKLNTNEGGGEIPSTSSAGTSRQSRSTIQTYMPHNHSTSMTHLISTNGRISGRNSSSSTSVGATSPLSPSSRMNDSTSAIESKESPPIEYVNAADIRETRPSRTEITNHPQTRPVIAATNGTTGKVPAKKVSLNYAHLKLGQDEEDAVKEDGSFQLVVADVDRVENEYEMDESEEAAVSGQESGAAPMIPNPVSLKDENDNKRILQQPKSRKVKTGLLVEIGSDVSRVSEAGERKISYVNLERSPKVVRPANRVHSPNHTVPTGYPPSPSSYYTNLDTKGELPPHCSISNILPEQRDSSSGLKCKSDHLEFNFEGSISPGREKYYANLVNVEGKDSSGSDPSGVSNIIIQSPPKGKLNYIQVAFEDGTVSSAPPRSMSSSSGSTPPNTPNSPSANTESPGKGSDVYAVIDTNKTVALANSQRQINDGDVGSRRTRHDGGLVQPR